MRAHLAALGACLLLCLPAALAACPFTAGNIGQKPINDIDTPPSTPWVPPNYTGPSNCSAEVYDEIAMRLVQMGEQDSGILPKFLRLGFHTCGTWSASGRNAGCNGGWLQYPIDYNNGANSGLAPTIQALIEFKKDYPCITHADLFTLAGAVSAEAAGGPPIAWYPGRLDATSPGPSTPSYSVRLPMGGFSASGNYYYAVNLGLTIREMTALTGGGHSIGGADPSGTGWEGAFTAFGDSWPTPSNTYFVDMLRWGWVPEIVGDRKRLQYVPAPGQNANYTTVGGVRVFRLPSDIAFRDNNAFGVWALAYAKNESAFVHDFQRAFQRVMQLGAGELYTLDTSYQWRGLAGDWEGFGPDIAPQLDTEDIPPEAVDIAQITAALDQIDDPSVDLLAPIKEMEFYPTA